MVQVLVETPSNGSNLLPKISKTYLKAVTAALEQGAMLYDSGRGRHSYKLRLPNGEEHPIPTSGDKASDLRGPRNFIAKMRRAGIEVDGRAASIPPHASKREQLRSWASRQKEPWTARQASEQTGIPLVAARPLISREVGNLYKISGTVRHGKARSEMLYELLPSARLARGSVSLHPEPAPTPVPKPQFPQAVATKAPVALELVATPVVKPQPPKVDKRVEILHSMSEALLNLAALTEQLATEMTLEVKA